MTEGLLLGGSGLGVLALIFEIAADAFSVAAYQTLLAISGASGHHEIAIAAFIVLSVLLFFGIVPAYKAGAYLKPNAGGSGPLVEAIGPNRMRFLSWIGTSLFFLDAILTIIISSISAADVTMLLTPEWAPYRILLAEMYAFFIMVVLVIMGPKRAVPLFLIGGGAFTIFTLMALTTVGFAATANPDWAYLVEPIVARLEATGVAEHVVEAQQQLSGLAPIVVFQFFMRSMSSAMLGFSGYEVIPASGKHAARPKWKVINTALTVAAVFLIGTGVLQLLAASAWRIPATEGYSTLLIEYEIVAAKWFGDGVPDEIEPSAEQLAQAEVIYGAYEEDLLLHNEDLPSDAEREELIVALAEDEVIRQSLDAGSGGAILTLSGVLLAIILLLAQGGGYVGGAAVAANAAQLGRLPRFFLNDRWGIGVIWGAAAIMIPIIRQVVIVEAYYAFGFVSAFIITSTTVFFVREDVLIERGIEPRSEEAKSLKFAGLRGMIASYFMGVVLITQKTDALFVIAFFGVVITILQILYSRGGWQQKDQKAELEALPESGDAHSVHYQSGWSRALDEARQRGTADLMNNLIHDGKMLKFNVPETSIRQVVMYRFRVRPEFCYVNDGHDHGRLPEPSLDLQTAYNDAYNMGDELLAKVEHYSHYGIFTFIDKYYHNWVNYEHGRDPATVQKAMLQILFPKTDDDEIWEQYQHYEWEKMPEPLWQFARQRYNWAKDQWPNLSDRITTVWTLQELGMIPDELDVSLIIAVTERNDLRKVKIHTHGPEVPEDENAHPSGGVGPHEDD
ncbi:MAG: hypothetical protein AAFV33_12910 [Chloroflexota bacterium]